MSRGRSILFGLGIEGHLYLLEEARRRFGVDIAGFVLNQEMQRRIDKSTVGKPDRLYSFPDFYLANSDAVSKLDATTIRNKIVAYERKWRIHSAATLFYYDRYIRRSRDYRPSIELMLLYMDFCAYVLECEDPIWLRSNITTFPGAVMQEACLVQGIPALKPRAACISGRIEFMDETCNGSMRGWRQCYETALAGNTNPKIANAADKWLSSFRNRPERPAYSEKASVVSFDIGRFAGGLWRGIAARFDRAYWESLINCPLDRVLYQRDPAGSVFIKDFLWRELRASILRRSRLFKESIDLNEPFIYLPLQFTPEISTLTHGLEYEDPLALVERAAKFCPAGYRIYVKEHTSMVGRRPLRTYRRMRKFHNVTIVPPTIGTFDLIRNAKAVMTVTSTAGWEAFVLGKPVLTLGHVFFQDFPNVLKLSLNERGTGQMRDYLDGFVADEEAIRAAVIAYFDCSYACETGDIGIEIERHEAVANAVLVVDAIEDQLTRFPLSSQDNSSEPAELRAT